MRRLDGKAAIVTGAGQGVGRGIALCAGDRRCPSGGRRANARQGGAGRQGDRRTGRHGPPPALRRHRAPDVDGLVASAVDAYGGSTFSSTTPSRRARDESRTSRRRTSRATSRAADRHPLVHASMPAVPESARWHDHQPGLVHRCSRRSRLRRLRDGEGGDPGSFQGGGARMGPVPDHRQRDLSCCDSPASEAFFAAHPEHLERIGGRRRSGDSGAAKRTSAAPAWRSPAAIWPTSPGPRSCSMAAGASCDEVREAVCQGDLAARGPGAGRGPLRDRSVRWLRGEDEARSLAWCRAAGSTAPTSTSP